MRGGEGVIGAVKWAHINNSDLLNMRDHPNDKEEVEGKGSM